MPRQNTIQTAWTKGEVSPLAAGRVDVNLYANGAKTIENLIVRPQGPLFRRSGTKFVRKSKLSTAVVRVVPFTVSDETAYVLEFGDGYIHLFKNKEPLLASTREEIESFTVANNGGLMQLATTAGNMPGWGNLNAFYSASDNGEITLSAGAGGVVRVTTTVPHTLRTGVIVFMRSNTDPNTINSNFFTVTRISNFAVDLQGTTFASDAGSPFNVAMLSMGLLPGDRIFVSGGPEYPQIADQFHIVKSVDNYFTFTIANVAYTTNNGNPTGEEAWTIPIEIATTYTTAQLPDLKFVQSNDVLYLFHPDHPTRKLIRLTDDGDREDWLLAAVDFKDGPYLPLNSLAPTVDEATPANGNVFRDVYFEVSSYAHTATVKSATDFTDATDDDGAHYLEYRVGDEWRLALIQNASISGGDLKAATVDIIDNVLLSIDETVRLKQVKSKPDTVPGSSSSSQVHVRGNGPYQGWIDPRNHIASDQTAANIPTTKGVLKSQFSNTFAQQDVGKFIRIVTGNTIGAASGPAPYWVQITKINDGTGATAAHSRAVTMATNNATGNYVITNEARTATLRSYRSNSTYAAFSSTDVGRLVRLGFAGRWTWGKITAYTSSSQVTLTLYEDMPRDPRNAANVAGAVTPSATYAGATDHATMVTGVTTGRTYDWRMGAWSDTTGYPTCGVFHEQRLWLGHTETQPQTFWGSISGDFENMAPTELDSTVLDDSAITYTLGSTQANPVKWMVSGPAMHIGTSGGEWQVKSASSTQDPITPSSIKATEYTGHGSGDSLPAKIGSSVVFADRSGKKVHEIFYAYEQDAVDSDELTIISEHILRDHGGVVQTAFQQKPHSIFWAVCADGTLAGMTFNKKQEVVAWHHHTIAGGTVEDICVIPSESGDDDEVWLVVARSVNGSTVRYIEVLEDDFYPASASTRTGMRFLDCHRLVENFSGTTITGLDQWEGLAVVVVSNGTRIAGTATVTSGAITLAQAANEVVVGLLPTCYVHSLPPEGGSQFGTSQGQTKRVVHLDCRFLSTANVSFGPALASLVSKNLTGNPNWFTGTDRLVPAHGYDVESAWVISQPEPYPLNLLFAVTKLETYE